MSTLGAFRGVCARRRLLQRPSASLSSFGPLSRSIRPATARVFTTSPIWRKDEPRLKTAQHEPKVDAAEPIKPESVQKEKPAEPAKQPSFLAEKTVSNKEQREADWTIIKDMARYLWPKDDLGTRFRVGLSVALLVGAKVASFFSDSDISYCSRVDCKVGPECANSFLFQKHHRYHEH